MPKLNFCLIIKTILIFFLAPCDEVTCGEHAFCKADVHEAYCICEDGWTFNPNDIAAGCVGKKKRNFL